jgi:mono/diheme cytochrome c family protein
MALTRLLAATAILSSLAHGAAAPMLPPAPRPSLLTAEAPRLEPGVVVTFTTAATGKSDVRRDRLIALAVPVGTPPSALLPAGPFRADWEASLTVPLRADYAFSFQGHGTATLTVNGQVVLTETGPALGEKPAVSVVLNKGANRIQVAYTSPVQNADASFRLFWSGKGFGPEPVPPAALSADMAGLPLRTADRVRAGRELFARLQCASCHDAGPATPAGMPELRDRAPSLAEAGARFRGEWIAAWILDPKSQRPDTPMPKVRLNSPQDAQDIAAYLASLGSAPAVPPPEAAAFVNGGGRLFADLRCVACHPAPAAGPEAGQPARVNLGSVAQKWQPAALTAFLQAPQKNHPATRMPDFRLSASEARQLTAFLLAGPRPGPGAVSGNPERGQAQFIASCLACHGPAGPGPAGAAPALPPLRTLRERDWMRGCLAETPADRGTAPDFGFDATQRDNLRAFAAAGADALAQDAPMEFARRQYVALNCAACHERDGQAADFTAFAEEAHALAKRSGAVETEAEGQSLSQDPPSLTWAGEKLRPEALLRLLAGKASEPARPWLKVKMPGFGAKAEGIASGLALEHGLLPGPETAPKADPDLAAVGERLVSTEFFGCVACHAAGPTPAAAPFGAPGINFALVPGRLRAEYYLRWLDNPPRLEPQTKMPRFTGDTGRSLQTEILDGDAHAQWDAILAYLTQLANP